MFAPTKQWRRWHRKVNIMQRRYAICSAIAATGVPSLVMARGHVIDGVSEVPLVISDKLEEFKKTKEAVQFLRRIHAYADIEKVLNSKRYRAGKGKTRNRRYKQKLGPLVIYNQDNGVVRAFRNIPGMELMQVDRMNLLKLAPGGHLGRFVIWTESAFRKLDSIYGTWKAPSATKSKWNLPQAKMGQTDLARILRSEEIVKAIRAPKRTQPVCRLKKNPLKNPRVMIRLNPYAAVVKRAAALVLKRKAAREGKVAEKRGVADGKQKTKAEAKPKKPAAADSGKKKAATATGKAK